jgi:aminoglycoside 6'-N-acetyltransferase I
MNIVNLSLQNTAAMEQTAALLVEGFRDSGSVTWTSKEEAMAEVKESLLPGRISRIAVDEKGDVVGWIGGIERYSGNVWELHPLSIRLSSILKSAITSWASFRMPMDSASPISSWQSA